MKKTINVTWAKGEVEKIMQFYSLTQARIAASDPKYWPNEIEEYKGMIIVLSDDKTGQELASYTVA